MVERAINVLCCDDDVTFRRVTAKELQSLDFVVFEAAGGEECLRALSEHRVDVVLLDLAMPRLGGRETLAEIQRLPDAPATVVLTGQATVESAVATLTGGADDYLTKPVDVDRLCRSIRLAGEAVRLRRENTRLRRVVSSRVGERQLVGESPAFREAVEFIQRVARSDGAVLLEGESGTGKELLARRLHDCSDRAGQLFLPVNCAAIPEHLLESELFGHVRGAFTGANTDKPGLFETADGGTLLLDEIGDMPLDLQKKLLRVLQCGEFRQLGSQRIMRSDVRVVSATNADMKDAVRNGKFREDLYYRIAVLPCRVPPLRERGQDVLLLLRFFLDRLGARGMTWSDEVRAHLLRYTWPGNVRELENFALHLQVLAESNHIEVDDLPAHFSGADTPASVGELRSLREIERAHVLSVYDAMGRNKTRAAKVLGISLRTLYNKLGEYGVS